MKGKGKVRPQPKGRAVDAAALEAVRALLGKEPRRRDLLIEHLHRINDRHGHLSAAHLAALAQEMNLSQAEVYEVATFYHHFDVIKEGETAPPAITVRVCDSIACELAGAHALLAKLPEKQRMAVQLRVDEGLSFREVGELIDSSEGAARVNYHHGIRKLREWMNDA